MLKRSGEAIDVCTTARACPPSNLTRRTGRRDGHRSVRVRVCPVKQGPLYPLYRYSRGLPLRISHQTPVNRPETSEPLSNAMLGPLGLDGQMNQRGFSHRFRPSYQLGGLTLADDFNLLALGVTHGRHGHARVPLAGASQAAAHAAHAGGPQEGQGQGGWRRQEEEVMGAPRRSVL